MPLPKIHDRHSPSPPWDHSITTTITTTHSSSPNDDFDFLSCPPTIQKKYFSSLERLRIAQRTAVTRERPTTAINDPQRPLTSSSPRSSRPVLARRNSSYFKNPSLFGSKKLPSPTTETFTLSDAQWYQKLPSKVQRRHFTEEERAFLSGNNNQPVIPDAADQRLFELSRSLEANRSVPSLHTALTSGPSSRSSISTFEAVDDMDDAMMDTFHCLDQDDDLDLASTLDDYHRFYAPKPKKQMSNHRPSFRKVMSLSSLPIMAANQEAPPPLPTKPAATASPTPQMPSTPSTPSFRKDSLSLLRPSFTKSHKHQDSTATLEPAATHYQDPSARLKLRVYLGSPQKFDEAIEFGFPSIEDAETRPMSRPSLSQRRFATAPASASVDRTFLDDGTPSVFDNLDASSDSYYEDEADEVQSLPERHSPYTPSDSQFPSTYLLSPSVASQPSLTSTTFPYQKEAPPSPTSEAMPVISKPTIRRDPSEPLAQVLAGNREMTLRMTLTRPDLRADESVLYSQPSAQTSKGTSKKTSADENRDPLALEQLPDLKEKAGLNIWDTLPPVKQNGLRRMWRKVSGKGS